MTKDEALQLAFEELEDVQFIDNTWQEASVSKAEAKEILRKLADRLTQRTPDDYWRCAKCQEYNPGNQGFCSGCGETHRR